jgi:hypothetical protein
MMKFKDEHGSLMMEAVLVLPIFVLIVFFVIQMTFVWTAKQMTYYAAYCGARAALVYNPADYGAEKQGDGSWSTGGFVNKGVVHQAACTVLSWVSWSLAGYDLSGGRGLFYTNNGALNELKNLRLGTYSVPLSSNVRNQVFVDISEYGNLGGTSGSKSGGKAQEAPIEEQLPAVTVRVRFRCPLFIPLGGPVVAYFYGANSLPGGTGTDLVRDSISVGGFNASGGTEIHAKLVSQGDYAESGPISYYSMVLEESCTMAKPYKTDTYPLMPKEDKTSMGMSE